MVDQMKESAVNTVRELLSKRLKSGGISTTRPDFYFQCEAIEPRSHSEGFEVRVKTWRFWSKATVQLNADTGDLMAYSIDRYSDPSNDKEMTREEALRVAAKKIEIPADATLRSFYHFNFAPNCKLARLEWERIYQGLRVEGDYLYVSIHPKTLRIVEFARKWRVLKLT